MSKYEIESLIKTMNNYDDLASKAKAKADVPLCSPSYLLL